MLKSSWPLWLSAGVLTLCIAGIAWLYTDVQNNARTIGTLQSANEANAKALQGLQEHQAKQDRVLQGWDEQQQSLNRKARARAENVREAEKNALFKTWADMSLPADAVRLLQNTDSTH